MPRASTGESGGRIIRRNVGIVPEKKNIKMVTLNCLGIPRGNSSKHSWGNRWRNIWMNSGEDEADFLFAATKSLKRDLLAVLLFIASDFNAFKDNKNDHENDRSKIHSSFKNINKHLPSGKIKSLLCDSNCCSSTARLSSSWTLSSSRLRPSSTKSTRSVMCW